jgi:signal transduction histidine kinase
MSRTDVWVAVLAGEAAWGAGDRPLPTTRLAAQVQVTGLLMVVSVMWTLAPERFAASARPWIPWMACTVATACVAVVLPRPLLLALGRRRPMRSPVRTAVLRLGASVGLYVGLLIVLPGWRALAVWPLGVAGGADSILTRWALGLSFRPRRFWIGLTRSPIMLGAAAALLLSESRLGGDAGTMAGVKLLVAFVSTLMAAWGTMALLDLIRRELDQRTAATVEQARREEHRRRAHWLHDDVCAELQLTSLRLRTARLDPQGVAGELADLDQRLRMRQTDELIASGDARMAELMQPALRRVQAAGVRLETVPSLDHAHLRLSVHDARLFTRVLGVLVSNAVNAGATRLSVELANEEHTIAITVIDDAGGFPDAPLPVGRGLERLMQELGPGALDIRAIEGGSRVTLTMPYATPYATGLGSDTNRIGQLSVGTS